MLRYDYLIVGAGLFGATLAHILHKKNKSVIVIEKRPYIAGNVYTEKIDNIIIHSFGPHIFHTNNERIWNFVSQQTKFNNFVNTPKAYSQGKYYSLPFNMNTFKELWDVRNAKEAIKIIKEQQKDIKHKPRNLEEKAISLVGIEIFEKLIKGYTQKQWGRECKDLPASIITRLPKRYSFNNNYYNDKYQGIPIKGYTYLVEKLLSEIKVVLNEDYILKAEYYNSIANRIIFTGSIDEYYKYCYGKLEYRTCKFKNECLETSNFQNNAIINYCDLDYPWTRIIEHKWFNFGLDEYGNNIENTIITKEYSKEFEQEDEPFYPIATPKNVSLYKKYKTLAMNDKKVIFGGRLGEYKYYNMDQTIEAALVLSEKLD